MSKFRYIVHIMTHNVVYEQVTLSLYLDCNTFAYVYRYYMFGSFTRMTSVRTQYRIINLFLMPIVLYLIVLLCNK